MGLLCLKQAPIGGASQIVSALAVYNHLARTAPDVFQYHLKAGDMTFLNNHFHLHGRSQFEDAQDIGERRHLRRLWLEAESWNGHRSRAMQNVWETARGHWAAENTSVQMWD